MVRITGDRIFEVPCLLGRKHALTRYIKQQGRWRPEVHEQKDVRVVYNIALEGNQNFIRADRLVLAGYAVPPRTEIAQMIQEVDQRLQNATAAVDVNQVLRSSVDAFVGGWDHLANDLRIKASLMGVLTIMDEAASRRLPLIEQLLPLTEATGIQLEMIARAMEEDGRDSRDLATLRSQVLFTARQVEEVQRRSAPLPREHQKRIELLQRATAVLLARSAADESGNRIDWMEELRTLAEGLRKFERRDWYAQTSLDTSAE